MTPSIETRVSDVGLKKSTDRMRQVKKPVIELKGVDIVVYADSRGAGLFLNALMQLMKKHKVKSISSDRAVIQGGYSQAISWNSRDEQEQA